MLNVINSETDNQAYCLIKKSYNSNELTENSDTFEYWINKCKTIRQFIYFIVQHYNLDVGSFFFTFVSFQSEFKPQVKTKEKVF